MKRTFSSCALALAMLLPSASALGWNNKGHMTVAYIAYENLKPAVRKKVDAMLAEHRDLDNIAALRFSKCDSHGQPGSAEYRRCLFINAATWPDFIRGDPRFYDETDPDSEVTEHIEGFPDMKVHKPWHFKDIPFSPDGSALTQPGIINAATAIHAFRHSIASPNVAPPYKAYFLSWLLHMTGDVHQPLHSASRFTKALSPPKHPDGDRGGNSFLLVPYPMPESKYPAEKLHSLWDGSLGTHTDLASIQALAAEATKAQPKPAHLSADENVWIDESFRLASAKKGPYALSPCPGSKGLACVTDAYFKDAQALARKRVALAGYRLADVLNTALK